MNMGILLFISSAHYIALPPLNQTYRPQGAVSAHTCSVVANGFFQMHSV
jgi:hypothetical protein